MTEGLTTTYTVEDVLKYRDLFISALNYCNNKQLLKVSDLDKMVSMPYISRLDYRYNVLIRLQYKYGNYSRNADMKPQLEIVKNEYLNEDINPDI